MAIDVEMLREALQALVAKIVAEIEILRAAGDLDLRKVAYVWRQDHSLRYSSDSALLNIADEGCEEIEWRWEQAEKFLNETIRPTLEYEDAAALVPNPDRLLVAFSQAVAYEAALSGSPNSAALIASLVRDVTHRPREYRMTLWLTCMKLSVDEIRVSSSLTLRRPKKRDLQVKVRADSRDAFYSGLPPLSFTCLADYRLTVSGDRDAQIEADRLITILRLYRLGSVASSRIDTTSDSFYFRGTAGMRGPLVIGCHVSEISESDIPQLGKLLESLRPLTPSRYEEPDRPHEYISTALDWYGRSLLESSPWEARVAWAVACLEALLGDNAAELQFRLSLRVSSLLRCFGFNPLDVKNNMSKAYKIRSLYVHGEPRKAGGADDLRELHEAVANYARIACVVMMQLNTGFKKKAISSALDEALIDDDRRQTVQSWCKSVALEGIVRAI